MKRRIAGVIAVLLALGSLAGCNDINQDTKVLQGLVLGAEVQPRTFEYKALSDTESYVIRGNVEDDFRISMGLYRGNRHLMDYVVSDDALAVRVVATELLKGVPDSLGHVDVDTALRAGEWVVDPSGAPPIVQQNQGPAVDATGDPFRDARDGLRYVNRSLTQSIFVKKFSLEDVEYRPQFDPWRYPNDRRGEIRYDLLAPPVPRNEGQSRTEAGVTAAHFRNMSVFVDDKHVNEVCSKVSVTESRSYVELKEKGFGSNTFQAELFRRIEAGQNPVPILERQVYLGIGYPDEVDVEMPDGRTGKLTTFLEAFKTGMTEGLLAPADGDRITDCRRVAKTN